MKTAPRHFHQTIREYFGAQFYTKNFSHYQIFVVNLSTNTYNWNLTVYVVLLICVLILNPTQLHRLYCDC